MYTSGPRCAVIQVCSIGFTQQPHKSSAIVVASGTTCHPTRTHVTPTLRNEHIMLMYAGALARRHPTFTALHAFRHAHRPRWRQLPASS